MQLWHARDATNSKTCSDFSQQEREPTLTAQKPIGRSPSNLPLQHLVDASDGSTSLYLGQQWLQPGDRVLDHTHPCEEILHFLAGEASVRLGDETLVLGPGESVFIPTGILHGFINSGPSELHLLVVFPMPHFAPTDIDQSQNHGK
jgi:quercetin dioxygenase-like cupin family protein